MGVIRLNRAQLSSHRISVGVIEKIVKLTYKGVSRRQIAERLGIGARTVYNYQKKFDLL